MTEKLEVEKRSRDHGGSRTHDLLIMRPYIYHCGGSTTAVFIPLLILSSKLELLDELIDFLIGYSEETRRHVDACIKEAISCAVKSENDQVSFHSIIHYNNVCETYTKAEHSLF